MKNSAFLALGLCSVALLSACKSQESAYRQAFEKAQQQNQNRPVSAPVEVAPKEQVVVTTPTEQEDATPVRTIQGGVTVVDGEALKAYSVVVGSFINRTNADGLASTLRSRGYASRVIKTNETINGQTGWYRVIASSFDSKAQAAQSKAQLSESYAGAWLLLNK